MCNLLAVDGIHDPGVASINAGRFLLLSILPNAISSKQFFCVLFFFMVDKNGMEMVQVIPFRKL